MRLLRLVALTAVAAALVGGAATTSLAENPYPINVKENLQKQIEFDPGTFVNAGSCFQATADVTEVFNVEVHALASGVDAEDNLIPPLHAEQTREESLLIVPTDPTLPTYRGHSTAHVTNPENSPNAVGTNTITLHGSDGSNLISHENVHVLVKANGIDLSVDNAHFSC
jgi:hypothetical protein